ncbi:MAG: SAM-dependent methyltransferase [Bacteroidetes bacterium]|mgnify:FL=1|jgi:16S rRNA (cytidine1402-2'-O)-methyltransferase|nr:SAM-dependent methyltransferase [Bacteroidota bacterium]
MQQTDSKKGILYLLPAPLGENPPLEVLPFSVKSKMEELDHFIIENEKAARKFIKKITPHKNQDQIQLYPLNKFTSFEEVDSYLDPCLQGISIGLMSDAGTPGIADPGALIVSKAHKMGIRVKPLVGPSSILLAMMSSGMNGQSFAFNGYLPVDQKERKLALQKFEKKAIRENQAQIFIETPYRSMALFKEILSHLLPNTLVCIGCDLTLSTEYIKTLTVQQWKKERPQLDKRPCIFILEAGF